MTKKANPARDWHHITVRDPKKWEIVGTIQFGRRSRETDRSDFGIQARVGKRGGKGGTKPVTLLFDPRLWTLERAKKWAKDHGEKVLKAVAAPSKPDHGLSDTALRIKSSRAKSDEVLQYRIDVLNAGVGVERSDIDRKRLMAEAKKRGLQECAKYALKHGVFTDGSKSFFVLPREIFELTHRRGAKNPRGKITFSVSPDSDSRLTLPFPVDMLRYDAAVFASSADKRRADAKKPGVLLLSDSRPTEGRWESFGWKVDWSRPA